MQSTVNAHTIIYTELFYLCIDWDNILSTNCIEYL